MTSLECGSIIENFIGYRGSQNTLLSMDPDTSALDVIQYEIDELGNESFINQFRTIPLSLKEFPASSLIWVCDSQEAASRYLFLEEGEQLTENHLELISEEHIDCGLVLLDDD